MHLERPGTWQHGVSVGRGVGFLEHVDVVGRFLLASRKGRAAELHALLMWWPHRNRCTVMSLLLCSFSSSMMASYHLSHMVFVFFDAAQQTFLLACLH